MGYIKSAEYRSTIRIRDVSSKKGERDKEMKGDIL
jgi:hypothetical protein